MDRIYQDIAARTGGDVYIGVIGPVRSGKSTFIKRFMETLVIPNIENVYVRERAKDELPQSGSGRTIMTAEPKFVPEDAVSVALGDANVNVRLIDCVGYMIPGASGQFEDGAERMVTTPWFDHEVTITEAAEKGTNKVITEHSTIGIVVTTDGTVTEIPRESYIGAEERVINELKALNKPFLILLNSATPESDNAKALQRELEEKYASPVMLTNCMTLTEAGIKDILSSVLNEFPVQEFGIALPSWFDALESDHPLRCELFTALRSCSAKMDKIGSAKEILKTISSSENISRGELDEIDLGRGTVSVSLELPRELFYQTISQNTGLDIQDDGGLLSNLRELAAIKSEYDKLAPALKDVMEKGYGVVMPDKSELHLEEPEIVKQSGRYGVRLKASAPSIHMIRANIETEVSPAIGGEGSSEEVMAFLLQEFDGNTKGIWSSNLFGKPLDDIASEGLISKIKKMPDQTRVKFQETLQRIINEGSNGLICIIV